MDIKHPHLKLAVCCMLATVLLPACGGGSSSSGGGADSRTYQQGYAAGTVATLDIVLADLNALQRSLAGSGAPAQTSRGALGRSFALLEPRQRETLAASLLTFIARVTEAREAAAAPTAGRTEAEAAQEAADDALRALQLVVAADTATRVGGGMAQTAAVAALNQIARVDAAAPDAQTRIDAALNAALTAAQNEVERLEAELSRLRTQLGQQEDGAVDLADLRNQISALQTSLTAAQSSLTDAAWRARGVKPGFGPVTASTRSSTGRAATVTFHRRTADTLDPAVYLTFDTSTSDESGDANNVFNPHGFTRQGSSPTGTLNWYSQQGDYTFNGGPHGDGADPDGNDPKMRWTYARNAYVTASPSIDLTPDPILYAAAQKRVIAADPNTGHFRARGSVYRTSMRGIAQYTSTNFVAAATGNADYSSNPVSSSTAITTERDANVRHQRLLIQGRKRVIGSGGDNWANIAQIPHTTFRYDADDGLTMGFGGDGVIFADLERYQAKGCATGQLNCNNAVTADIEISFGAPDFDPAHQGMFHWSADVVSPRLGTDGTAAAAPPRRDHGQYHLLLSNDAGAGRRMLSYAAYGLFNFSDNLYAPGTGTNFYGRVQTFHYGAEAFADESGRRVSDMGRISATFRGRTHGWIVAASPAALRRPETPDFIGTLTRMRGDLTLTANIGGSQADTISGTISSLRQSPVHDHEDPIGSGVTWVAGGLPERVELQGAYANGVIGVAPILAATDTTTPLADFAAVGVAHGALAATAAVEDDGSFEGTVVPMGERAANWERGEHEGALYGPTGALEAAGTWWLQAARGNTEGYDGIIGSFGAVCATGCN